MTSWVVRLALLCLFLNVMQEAWSGSSRSFVTRVTSPTIPPSAVVLVVLVISLGQQMDLELRLMSCHPSKFNR